MITKKRFEMISKSLDVVNEENGKLKNKNAGLESIVQRQERTIHHLNNQIAKAVPNSEVGKRNRALAKEVKRLESIIEQHRRRAVLVRNRARNIEEIHAVEITG